MNTEVIEGNQLIAEFMNWSKLRDGYYLIPNNYPAVNNYSCGYTEFAAQDLSFDCNWNYLMPVVEKIESIDKRYSVEISLSSCRISDLDKILHPEPEVDIFDIVTRSDSKVKAVWQAVVEFIKWYNSVLPVWPGYDYYSWIDGFQSPKVSQWLKFIPLSSLLKNAFYKGFEKAKNDDANCFTAWREEADSLLNAEQNVQVCDATESQSSTEDGQTIPSIAAGNQIPGDDLADIAFDRPVQSSEDLIEQLQAENLRLKSWKRQATEVMPDFQELGKLMGLPLGAGVSENIIPYIKKLQADNQRLKERLKNQADTIGGFQKGLEEMFGFPKDHVCFFVDFKRLYTDQLAAKEALNSKQ